MRKCVSWSSVPLWRLRELALQDTRKCVSWSSVPLSAPLLARPRTWSGAPGVSMRVAHRLVGESCVGRVGAGICSTVTNPRARGWRCGESLARDVRARKWRKQGSDCCLQAVAAPFITAASGGYGRFRSAPAVGGPPSDAPPFGRRGSGKRGVARGCHVSHTALPSAVSPSGGSRQP